MWSTDLADVAAVGGSWGQQFLVCHSAGHTDTCTPVGGDFVEVGDKFFSWQGVFAFSSHTCLAWEALSCRTASPLSLFVQRVCLTCDLLP
jgi:hypothetical protein